MSYTKGPEVLASEPNIQDTLKDPLSQEGNISRLLADIQRLRLPTLNKNILLTTAFIGASSILAACPLTASAQTTESNHPDFGLISPASTGGYGDAGVPGVRVNQVEQAGKDKPKFVLGFAHLKSVLGELMGDPLDNERPNPKNGDSLQLTSTGLAFYDKKDNVVKFYDPATGTSYAWTERGLITWMGDAANISHARVIDWPALAEAGVSPEQMTNELLKAQIGRDPLAENPQLESFFMQIKDLEQNPKLTPVRYKTIQKLKTIMMAKGISMWNPLGINPEEALEFARSNDKTIFPSFREWKSPDGQHSIIIVTGPKPETHIQGLGAVRGNIENLEAALNKLYQLDPDFFRNYPVNAITGLTRDLDERGYFGTFDILIKSLSFTEVRDPYGPIDVYQLMEGILVEAWHMRYRGAPDKPNINLGIGKANFSIDWITRHASSFPSDIVRVWKDLGKQLSTFYAANPWKGE